MALDSEIDGKYMLAAIAQARMCQGEDKRIHPKVGVVVVSSDGRLLAEAYRGQSGAGQHAEYIALERLPNEILAGATVYTTLEPCTTRNHPKVPCAHRLIDRKVGRVVIGMLDPNPNILGRGVLELRERGIAVELFPHELMGQLEELNRDFKGQYPLAPPLTPELMTRLASQPLDDWYHMLNRMYWNRNFQRDPAAIFTHLVEVIGTLSVLVSKKSDYGSNLFKYMAKAFAWWFALCGKVGVKSVSAMLWGKFPNVCPYCRLEEHKPDPCMRNKVDVGGPDWTELQRIGKRSIERQPKGIAEWQKMFGAIYQTNSTEEFSKIFAKLTEEVGELAEALRVFPAAPGYFLSEASDVFAWLMKLNNMVEVRVQPDQRGLALQMAMAESYPDRCRDCNSGVCTCPPILPSTIGRIAHEVPSEFVSYAEEGSFLTADRLSDIFGHGALKR